MRVSFRMVFSTAILLLLSVLPLSAQLNRYYYYGKTHKDYLRGEYARAIRDINVFLAYQPHDDIGLYLRALCKYELKDYRGALSDLDTSLMQKPFGVDLLVLRAATKNEMGQAKEALRDISLAQELRPNARNIVYIRGITYFQLEDYPKAIEDFDRTLRHEPSHLGARINRGTASLLSKDTVGAILDYRTAVHSNPYSAVPHVNLARLYFEGEKLDSALVEVNQALDLDPQSHQALLIKALVQHRMGKSKEAIGTLTTTLRMAPRNSLALYNRALIYSELKEWRAALGDYQAAASISPTNVLIRYNMGITELQLGRKARAEATIGKAIQLYPEFAQAYRLRGRIRQARGNEKGAYRDFSTAEELSAKYARGELGGMSDTSARFSKLMAFEHSFNTSGGLALALEGAGDEMLPLATVSVGQLQPYGEWAPVVKVDSVCHAPYFALVVPSLDTARTVDLSMFPPLQNIHAVNLVRVISQIQMHEYDAALSLLDSIGAWGDWAVLAKSLRATTLIQKIRYAPETQLSLNLTPVDSGEQEEADAYQRPIAILDSLQSRYPSPYLLYTRATAYYLSKDLASAERDLTEAVTRNRGFAEAYYNRALVRLLMRKADQACRDLSTAGELGIDQAYRIIASQCRR